MHNGSVHTPPHGRHRYLGCVGCDLTGWVPLALTAACAWYTLPAKVNRAVVQPFVVVKKAEAEDKPRE